MNLSKLSNQELINKLLELRGTEKETTLAVLYHLIELDSRKLVIELGYSSVFDYCLRVLGYSESGAGRRVAAAKAIKSNPELAELFLQGKVTLCTISAASVALRERTTEVREIIGKSKAEVQELIAPKLESKPKEVIKPVIIEAPAVPLLNDTPKEQRYEIKFTVTKEAFDRFNEARRKLSNSTKDDQSVEATIGKLVDHYLSPKERKVLSLSNNGRYIPRSVKREVYERDNGRCCFVSKDGIRCTESKFIQIDHVVPFAKGGKTELSNLRLLCSAHNQHCAEKEFGHDFIQTKIQSQLVIL